MNLRPAFIQTEIRFRQDFAAEILICFDFVATRSILFRLHFIEIRQLWHAAFAGTIRLNEWMPFHRRRCLLSRFLGKNRNFGAARELPLPCAST